MVADPAALDPTDPAHTQRVPEQCALTHLIYKVTQGARSTDLSDAGRQRVSHLARQSVPEFDAASPLNDAHAFHATHKLKHSPLQFLTCISSLSQPFLREPWSVYAAYTLGGPMPKSLQPSLPGGEPCPCHCKKAVKPDPAGHHKMNCNNAGTKGAHDHLDDSMAAIAKPSCTNWSNNKDIVPTHVNSNEQGDALANLTNGNKIHVFDFTIVHPYNGKGEPKPNVIRDAYNAKKAKHAHAYHIQQGMQFVPLVVNTYGRAEADFVRLMLVLAARQAEVIIAHHRPDADFVQQRGVCFANIKAQVGAACARAMAMRALSCTKNGYRKFYARDRRPEYVAQPPQVLGDIHGVFAPHVVGASLAA